ncbi:unnamed protein product [Caenorhabditis bovis]|uniref:2-(3-amino-3-carboxypropyl)histidine synthase subunit 2 n=1 Tax=Caenorhabditis bovis TaxID=2654633 RepID=A0A8S1ERK9_9PELO|nr:unnamed protein product [Caenorhabditis bovis]
MSHEDSVTTSQFFSGATPAEIHLEESSSVLPTILTSLDEKKFGDFFEISETIEWIRKNDYKRIALQFPDEFLQCSRRVSVLIEDKTGAKTYILADTSYRSCCIDEVAAAHAICDALIHYGEACLSIPTLNIPVKYDFSEI